jgi:type 1 glutamine amidotransferase
MTGTRSIRRFVLALSLAFVVCGTAHGTESEARRPARILLIGQGPDSHARGTHEYMAGVRIMQHILNRLPDVQVIVTKADGPWADGPEMLQSADGVFLFVSEGAKWLSADASRLEAFQELAKRGGGLCCWHWGMGCRDAEPIADYVALFGACHGGPDRKHKVMETTVSVATKNHAVLRGVVPFDIKEEFYFSLKRHPDAQLQPLLTIPVDNRPDMVCWAWQRPDRGRSCGFSGGHFHELWLREDYRRLAVQSVLWSVGREDLIDELSIAVPDTLLSPQFTTAATPAQ